MAGRSEIRSNFSLKCFDYDVASYTLLNFIVDLGWREFGNIVHSYISTHCYAKIKLLRIGKIFANFDLSLSGLKLSNR